MIHIRRAGVLDARPMAELLNAIIAKGGTTAMTEPVTRETLLGWMGDQAGKSAWLVAEDELGELLGFQYIAPHADLPPEACDIASFVRIGQTGLGVGSSLFETTRAAARRLGYRWINATIRTDNTGGLAYYQSCGFENYARRKDLTHEDGSQRDRISKRFDL